MRTILLILIFLFLSPQTCHGIEEIDSIYPESELRSAMDKLPSETADIVEAYDMKSGDGIRISLGEIWALCIQAITEALNSLWRPITTIFMTIMLCCILEPMFAGSTQNFVLLLFGSMEILYVSLWDAHSLFSEGVEALGNLYDFSTVLLPCLAGISVAAGASISAGVKYTSASLFMNLLLNFSNSVLIPAISVYLASLIGSVILKQKLLGIISKFIRWGCKTMVTASTVIFTAYLNVAGLIASTGDLFAVRATKTAITTALPVVGGILASAASSLVAGASVLRSTIGVFGLLSVMGMLTVPFIKLCIRYLLYLAVSNLADLFPERRFVELLAGIAGAYGMILGVIGSGFIMIFLTLFSFMQIVGGG